MNQPHDYLRPLLNNDDFYSDLYDARQLLMKIAIEFAKQEHPEDLILDSEYPLWASRVARRILSAADYHYGNVLQSYIIDKIPQPTNITLNDLKELFCESLMVRDDEHEDAFDRFCNNVVASASTMRRSTPFVIARLNWEDHAKERVDKMLLGEYGMYLVELLGATPAALLPQNNSTPLFDEYELLYGCACSFSTRSAMDQFSDRIIPLIQSVARSFQIMTALDGSLSEDFTEKDKADFLSIPSIQWKDMDAFGAHIKLSLELCSLQPEKGDTISQRLKNAIELIAEADNQNNDAIALSLCFAAIEAMLSKGTTNINEHLASSAAVLLEPDKMFRMDAQKTVKELYNLRSRVLHGNTIAQPAARRLDVRLLATAILMAFLNRMVFMKNIQDTLEKPKDLLKEISAARETADSVVGVKPTRIVRLWRHCVSWD